MSTPFFARVLDRMPLGARLVRVVGHAVDMELLFWARQPGDEGILVGAGQVGAEAGLEWARGPIDALVIDRAAAPPETVGAILNAWSMHVATSGLLVLVGYTPAEHPVIPPLAAWRGPDSRLWTPIAYEGARVAWQCVGYMGDQA